MKRPVTVITSSTTPCLFGSNHRLHTVEQETVCRCKCVLHAYYGHDARQLTVPISFLHGAQAIPCGEKRKFDITELNPLTPRIKNYILNLDIKRFSECRLPIGFASVGRGNYNSHAYLFVIYYSTLLVECWQEKLIIYV